MKCLGALDSFIVRLFILEALVLGILGSVAGAIAGTALVMVMQSSRLGWSAMWSSWGTTAVTFGGGALPGLAGGEDAAGGGAAFGVLGVAFGVLEALRS